MNFAFGVVASFLRLTSHQGLIALFPTTPPSHSTLFFGINCFSTYYRGLGGLFKTTGGDKPRFFVPASRSTAREQRRNLRANAQAHCCCNEDCILVARRFMNIIAMRQINVKKYAKSAAINAKDP